jgi:hypothetical protein
MPHKKLMPVPNQNVGTNFGSGFGYSSNKIRKTQNEQLIIDGQNLIGL